MDLSDDDPIATHPLLKMLFDSVAPTLQESLRSPSMEHFKWPKKLVYHREVFERTTDLTKIIDALIESENFMEAVPSPRFFRKFGISQNRWIEYHYTAWLIRFVSASDTALVLTNSVFDIGLRERDCNLSVITNQKYVQGCPVKAALKELEAVVSPFRTDRNLPAHKGRWPDPSRVSGSTNYKALAWIASTYTIDIMVKSKQNRSARSFVTSRFLQTAIQREITHLLLSLRMPREELSAAIIKLLDSLLPVYQEKASSH